MGQDDLGGLDAARRATWVNQLQLFARRQPTKAALVDSASGRVLTYAELGERVARLAGALRSRGVGVGDRVLVLMSNRLEFLEATLAANHLGAIAVPVNFRLVAEEVAYLAEDSGSVAVLVDAPLAGLAGEVRAKVAELRACLVVGGADEVSAAGTGAEGYEEALGAAAPVEAVALPETEPAFILYTSGTTGRPKGAVLTQLNMLMQTLTQVRTWRLVADDEVNLCGSPLFHIAAIGSVLPFLLLGNTTVLMPSGAFDPGDVVDLMERYRVTHCFLVPAQWQAVCSLEGVRERDLHLRAIAWGAAPAPLSVLQSMAATFPGVEILAAFGQTEMSPVTCVLEGRDAQRKIGSVGKPVATVDVRIVDPDMRDVEPGEVGEIVYRGPALMTGYWNKPEATAEAFRGGWFHSGDLVREDEEGFLYVVDRAKDMIISGGENIYSAEVEQAIDGHPGVAQVAVVGVPHPRWGETPIALVVPADPADPPREDDVLDRCRRHLASYKKPSRVIVVDELPRNAGGKVLKYDLRRRYQDLMAEPAS